MFCQRPLKKEDCCKTSSSLTCDLLSDVPDEAVRKKLRAHVEPHTCRIPHFVRPLSNLHHMVWLVWSLQDEKAACVEIKIAQSLNLGCY